MIHKVVHVLVFNKKGEILLQKRALNKDVAPGRWDTSVGGHVSIGENLIFSSKREMQEELSINGVDIEFLYSYIHRNNYESDMMEKYFLISKR